MGARDLDTLWRHDGTVLARTAHRMAMADVDASRHIYFARPYDWQQLMFCNWLADRGHGIFAELENRGQTSPAVASHARYAAPLWLDAVADLHLVVADVGRTSFTLRMDAYRGDVLAVQTMVTHVWTDYDGMRPVPLPDWLRAAFAGEGR